MEYAVKLTLFEFLLPPVCASALFTGFLLFLFMFIKYPTKFNLSILLMGLCGTGFVGSEMMILGVTYWNIDSQVGTQFHRIEQLSGLFFLFTLPFSLSSLLRLNETWRKVNRIVYLFGLIISLFITFMAFADPDSFISMVNRTPTWNIYHGDFTRGKEGYLYNLRDTLLFIVIFYSIISFIYEFIKNRRFSQILLPFIGVIIAVMSAVEDISMVQYQFHIFTPEISFSRFSLGITFWILLTMANEIAKFVDSAKELEQAHVKIKKSEEKYKLLVEETNDFVFILNREMKFITANKSMTTKLKIGSSDIIGKSIYDVMFKIDEGSKLISKQIVEENIRYMLLYKTPFRSKIKINTGLDTELKEYYLKMQMIEINNDVEIIAQASKIDVDSLIDYFDKEEQTYYIKNFLSAAEEMSDRMAKNLHKYCKPSVANIIRIGLREMIINAIEHGNLNISFQEKSAHLAANDYFDYIKQQQANEKNTNKRVLIKYSIDSIRAEFIIADEGDGFDYNTVMADMKNKVDSEMLLHGRGITMVLSLFDVVEYNDKGNQVKLVKFFEKK